MSNELKEARVNWSVHGWVDCPHCDHSMDFMNEPDFYEFSNVGENVEKFRTPYEVTCSSCKKTFNVVGSDY